MSSRRRCAWLLFAACWFIFGYFNQGGGWNQNARLAEVRALVETGHLELNSYLIYQRDPATRELVRCPVQGAEYQWQGERHRLCWADSAWHLFPIGQAPLGEGVKKVALIEQGCSGDIGYVPEKDAFHPNKPPGTTFAAVPAYFLLYHLERWLGVNPDGWWPLSVNAWLASAGSVGLASAVGCVLLFLLACELGGGRLLPALAVALAGCLGTTFFPFATLLFDHALGGASLLGTFYLLRVRPLRGADFLAGLCAGGAVLTNYVNVVAVVGLGVYALHRSRAWRPLGWYALGGLGPFLLLCWYGQACYGSPFRPGTDFQNPLFRDPSLLLGMFEWPRSGEEWWRVEWVLKVLLFSPFRGVFYLCPVLLLGVAGLVRWFRRVPERRPEAWLCLGIFALFLTVNAFFNGFHAGYSAGPRYLVPGLLFLALPAVAVWARWRWVAWPLLALSVGVNALLTVTDAQNPTGVGGHTRTEQHPDETYSLVGEYAWPLFTAGRAWPLLAQVMEAELQNQPPPTDDAGASTLEKAQREEELRRQWQEGIRRGEAEPFLLGSIEGPVSVNPVGVFEGLFNYLYYPPGSEQVRWASFNLGEFLWPQSRRSLLPLAFVGGGLLGWAGLLAARADRRARAPASPPAR